MSRKAALVPSRFDAVAFDLDGVVTDTARIHFKAWQQTFECFFEGRTRRTGVSFAPFTLEDYRSYIDGRPHEEAIRAFLAARGLEIEEGGEADSPEAETVHVLARRKDGLFLERMRSQEVEIYPFHPALPDELRRLALRLRYRQHSLSVDITQDALTLSSDPSGAEAISIAVGDRHILLHPGDRTSVPLARPSQ